MQSYSRIKNDIGRHHISIPLWRSSTAIEKPRDFKLGRSEPAIYGGCKTPYNGVIPRAFFLSTRPTFRFTFSNSILPQPYHPLAMTSTRYPPLVPLGLVFVRPVQVEGLDQPGMTGRPVDGEHNVRFGRRLKKVRTGKN